MTYRQLKEKIESMPQEWLDKDVRVVGKYISGTPAYLGKASDNIFWFFNYDEAFSRNELDDEEFENDGKFKLLAYKGDYSIFLDE